MKKRKDLPVQHRGKLMIVKKFNKKPLLLNGYKFDLRIYVVLCGFDPVQAFIADEGFARFCPSQYETPTEQNLGQVQTDLDSTSHS